MFLCCRFAPSRRFHCSSYMRSARRTAVSPSPLLPEKTPSSPSWSNYIIVCYLYSITLLHFAPQFSYLMCPYRNALNCRRLYSCFAVDVPIWFQMYIVSVPILFSQYIFLQPTALLGGIGGVVLLFHYNDERRAILKGVH